jgi:hypothetical protein
VELTIKKASDIRAAAVSAADAIKVNTTVKVSVFSSQDPGSLISDGSSKIMAQINDQLRLLDVAFNIKLAIGEKNDAVGITRLLREGARLETKIAKLAAFAKILDGESVRDRFLGRHDPAEPDVEAVAARIESVRTRLNNPEHSGTVEEEFAVSVVTDKMREDIADIIATLRRSKTSVSDDIAVLNSTTKITINSEDEDILRKFKIL